MREIKFRVFDPNTNEMIASNVGLDKIHLYDFDGDNITEQEGLIIMQYTGLKDKNGREIYEGDIINFEDAYYSTSENGQEFEVFQNKGVIEYCSEELRYYVTNKQSIDDEQIFDDEIEVIGNIYENPELLEAAG